MTGAVFTRVAERLTEPAPGISGDAAVRRQRVLRGLLAVGMVAMACTPLLGGGLEGLLPLLVLVGAYVAGGPPLKVERRTPARLAPMPDPVEPSAMPAPVRPLRVLVADDNELNLRVMLRVLGRRGLIPDLVSNGERAVSAAQSHRYDLIFMDLSMPGVDGLEATRRILGSHRTGAVPRIVAMTASATPEDRELCARVGMSGLLAKPYRAQELFAIVDDAIRAVRE